MNKVMEVARADDVTGNLYSVAITAQDRVHFVKGTCKEESTWWLEVLQDCSASNEGDSAVLHGTSAAANMGK